jgi:hypothetical protein
MGEDKAREEDDLAKIERGEDLSSNGDGAAEEYDEDDYQQDQDDDSADEDKLDTVGEGNETNQMTTGEKGMGLLASSGSGLANLRNINELGDNAKQN